MKAAATGTVTVKIFDLSGEQICEIYNQSIPAGLWIQAIWDGRNKNGATVANGLYFVSVRGAGINTIRKVIVLK